MIDSVKELNSFDDANLAKLKAYAAKDTRIAELLDSCPASLYQCVLQNLDKYGLSEELNDIVIGNFVSPVTQCLQKGFSPEFIKESINSGQVWKIQYAAMFNGVNPVEENFSQFVSNNNLNGDEEHGIVCVMLQQCVDADTARMLIEYSGCKPLLDSRPDWVKTFEDLRFFVKNVYNKDMPIWYVDGVCQLTREDVEVIANNRYTGNCLAALALSGMFPGYVPRLPMKLWICIDLDTRLYYPCYAWRDLRESYSSAVTGTTIRHGENTIAVIHYGFGLPPEYPNVSVDTANPVRAFSDAQCTAAGFPIAYSDMTCYLSVFPAILAVRAKKTDWIIFLKFNNLFGTILVQLHKTFFETLLMLLPIKQYPDSLLQNGLVRIGDNVMTIPVAFLERSSLSGNEICYVGAKKDGSLSINDVVESINNWLRQH